MYVGKMILRYNYMILNQLREGFPAFFTILCAILDAGLLATHLISGFLNIILTCKIYIVQKMKFFIKDFFSKCDQIHNLMENFIFLCNDIKRESFCGNSLLTGKQLKDYSLLLIIS